MEAEAARTIEAGESEDGLEPSKVGKVLRRLHGHVSYLFGMARPLLSVWNCTACVARPDFLERRGRKGS